MILSCKQYSQQFKLNNKTVSAKTVQRRAKEGLLPSGHVAKQMPGKRGPYVIEIKNRSKT